QVQLLVGSSVELPVLNPSFEQPALADGGFTGTITDWQIVGAASGVFNPTATQYPTQQATDGEQVAYSNGGSIRQTLAAMLEANTTYTLQVDIGDRLDTGVPGYTVELWAGGVLLASVNQTDFPTV